VILDAQPCNTGAITAQPERIIIEESIAVVATVVTPATDNNDCEVCIVA